MLTDVGIRIYAQIFSLMLLGVRENYVFALCVGGGRGWVEEEDRFELHFFFLTWCFWRVGGGGGDPGGSPQRF